MFISEFMQERLRNVLLLSTAVTNRSRTSVVIQEFILFTYPLNAHVATRCHMLPHVAEATECIQVVF
jgi:hypothetical protein